MNPVVAAMISSLVNCSGWLDTTDWPAPNEAEGAALEGFH
jgi:hypothetical protein